MIVLGCGINHISYWCTNQSIMQRVLGAKNLKEAQKGSLLTGLTCVFCPIFLVAPGVIQFIRDGGVLTDFDMVYPVSDQGHPADSGTGFLCSSHVRCDPVLL